MVKCGIIASETQFIMDLSKEILQGNNNKLYFVPLREMISKNGILPVAPNGLKIYRESNKYEKLLSKAPSIIFTYSLDNEFIKQLLNVKSSHFPKIIVLSSRNSLYDYQNLSKKNKSKLSDIKFISFWNSKLKLIGDLGAGESIVKVVNKLKVDEKSNILLVGYGKVGSKIAHYLVNEGYNNVAVCDRNPTNLVIAQHCGLQIGKIIDLAKNADFLIDATGSKQNFLTNEILELFRKPQVNVISISSNPNITVKNGYKNKSGATFRVDPSATQGEVNLSYEVGGISHKYRRVWGLTVLYFCLNYNKICEKFDKYFLPYDGAIFDKKYKNNYSLHVFNDVVEKSISRYILSDDEMFGGPTQQYYSSNFLSESELRSVIVDKVGIHKSLSHPSRRYDIYYYSNGSFKINTMDGNSILGTSTGTYIIKKDQNYDIGIMDVKYTSIYESPYMESVFNKKHPNSIHNTMEVQLGYFELHSHETDDGRKASVLEYKCNNFKSNLHMTTYPIPK